MVPWPEIITTGRSGCMTLIWSSKRQPVEPRALQPDVEEDQARRAIGDRRERAVAVVRRAGLMALVAQDTGDEFADVFFVVDDEDVRRHC